MKRLSSIVIFLLFRTPCCGAKEGEYGRPLVFPPPSLRPENLCPLASQHNSHTYQCTVDTVFVHSLIFSVSVRAKLDCHIAVNHLVLEHALLLITGK